MYKRLIVSLLLLANLLYVFAVPASPDVVLLNQINGNDLAIKMGGDEYFHYTLTSDGFLIAQNALGIYEYAEYKNSEIILSGVAAENPEVRSKDHAKYLHTFSVEDGIEQSTKMRAAYDVDNESLILKKDSQDTIYIPVILVSFSDKKFVYEKKDVDSLLNAKIMDKTIPTGSARTYLSHSTNKKLNVKFDIYGPYDIPGTCASYGANEPSCTGMCDINPRGMVIDACNAADADIVFSNYAIDGVNVDQVLVIYAGYSEAENATYTDFIWPHRWQLANKNTILDGVIIYDYACASEMKGDYSKHEDKLCGIGTIVHEFSHILGLKDLYPTNGGTHFTVGYWDVMCYGVYLNEGMTPPLYSAYERFYLGYLTPIQITNPSDVQVPPLYTTNQAYLICEGEHNLDGKNPIPSDFYLLENRREVLFDYYLFTHGMLITKVHYDAEKWQNSQVNNDESNLGVSIISAGNNTSYLGSAKDIFPGQDHITEYLPLEITDIVDWQDENLSSQNLNVSFKYKGGLVDISKQTINTCELSYSNNTLTITGLSGASNCEIYDMSGLLRSSVLSDNYICKIPVSELSNGLYLVKISDDLCDSIHKWMKY
ncbi:MAG: M6 family metalloprotease domain-containing protein [Bacteroidia bacterium]|nr:M6 family metalloprotease domain-containing protein [Bacteroidia bacterium]